MIFDRHDSPVGDLLAVGDGTSILGLYLPAQQRSAQPDWRRDEAAFAELWRQLEEYFAGTRDNFDLALTPVGTPLQQAVWARLREIPLGRTVAYGALAQAIGRPGAARAVGAAVGRNPISIVIPCHRVIASTGALTGYAGGLAAKRWLLGHEQVSGVELSR